MGRLLLLFAAIALLSGACGASPEGSVVLFADSFDIAAFSYDINQGYTQGRQSGLLSPIPWSTRPEYYPGQSNVGHVVLHHPWMGSALQFFVYDRSWPDYYGGPLANYAWGSPNRSFTDARELSIDFDVDPIAPNASGDATDHFAAVVFGASVQGTYAIPMSGEYQTAMSPGMSFWIQDEGRWSVQKDNHVIASGEVATPKPGWDSFYHVTVAISTAGWGNGSDAHISILVDGQTVYSGVRVGGFTSNHITLSALGLSTTQYNTSQFDNLVISTLLEPIVIAEAKRLQDGAMANVTACVSAKFGEFLYIESEDRSSGIRVVVSDAGLGLGSKVRVVGRLHTLGTGERAIVNANVSALTGSKTIAPLGVSNRALGGGGFYYHRGPPPSGQQGVRDGVGLNNIGLLVRTTGRVTSVARDGPNWALTISDGSGPDLLVELPQGCIAPPVGSWVAVTGISSCVDSGVIMPKLLVRSAQDLQRIWSPPAPRASISDAKMAPDSTRVGVTAYVSARFGEFFYMETADRTSGIRVAAPDAGLEVGREVEVVGTLSTMDTGERVIMDADVTSLAGSRVIAPLGMANCAVGGGDFSFRAGPPASGQRGVENGVGLNNIGLLVKTTGRITFAGKDRQVQTMVVTDGSGAGLRVDLPEGIVPPPVGSDVAVTGISSCVNTGTITSRLLARGVGDVQEMRGPVVRRLLIDDTFIESTVRLTRQMHPLVQYSGNPIIVQDRPWECHPDFRYYPSVVMWANPVIWDPAVGKWRMWYSAYCDRDPIGRDTELLLYAESNDGIEWTKPSLRLVEWNGSTENNIVMVGITDNIGGARYLDTPNVIYRPDAPDPANRYMLFAAHWTGNGLTEGVWIYRSPDGFHWEMLKGDAVPNAREFNSFFWDPIQRKFIGNVRIRNPMLPRHVGYAESYDGINWTPASIILAPADLNTPYNLPGDDVYGLVSFRYQSHCIGFLHTHHADRRLEVQLMASQDGRDWRFVSNGQYILPNDPPGGYGQGMMSTQCGEPTRVGDELWVYIGVAPAAHTNPDIQPGPGQQRRAIGLAKIRVDGFVSMDAGILGGALVTKPFTTPRSRLLVNVDSAAGSMRAEVIDEAGQPIPGLTSAECIPITADSVAREVRWASGARIPTDKVVKLRFLLYKASIYSYWTED